MQVCETVSVSRCVVSSKYIYMYLTTTYYLKDCLLGSVLLILLSSGCSPIFLLALSPSKHRSIIPVMTSHLWCSARFSSRGPTFFYPLHYSTQFTHQSILNNLYAEDTQL